MNLTTVKSKGLEGQKTPVNKSINHRKKAAAATKSAADGSLIQPTFSRTERKRQNNRGKLCIKAYEGEIHRQRNEVWFANEMPFYAYSFGTNVKV